MRIWTVILMLMLAAPVAAQKDGPDDDAAPPEGRLSAVLDPGTHAGGILHVFSRDAGKQVVTVGEDLTVRLWDVEEQRQVKVICPPGYGEPTAAAMSAAGDRLAVAVRYAEKGKAVPMVYVLSLPAGDLTNVLRGHAKVPTSLSFGPGGRLISASHLLADGGVLLWDLKDEAPKPKPIKIEGRPGGLAFSPDGKRFAWVGGTMGGIVELATKKALAPLKGQSVVWSPDGKTLATADPASLRLYDPAGELVATIANGVSRSLAFSGDSKALLLGGRRLIDVATKKATGWAERAPYDNPALGALSADGKLAVTAGRNDQRQPWLLVRETATGKEVFGLTNRGMFVTPRAVANPLRWAKDGNALCWHPPKQAREFREATFHLRKLELLPSLAEGEAAPGPILEQGRLSLKAGGKAAEWDVVEGGKTLAPLERRVWLPTFVGKDRIVAVQGEQADATLSVFDARTGKLVRRLESGYREPFSSVKPSPSPDGRYVATYHKDRAAYVWSPEQTKPLLTIYRNGNDWITWTKEGYYAATPGGERMVRWKFDNGIDKMPTVETVDRFRALLYRPEVIAKACEVGSVTAALKVLDPKQSVAVDVSKYLPPRAGLRVKKLKEFGEYEIEAFADARVAGQPIMSQRLMMDGRPLLKAEDYEAKPLDSRRVTWKVTIPPGTHTLDVLTRSKDASSRSEPIVLVNPTKSRPPTLHFLAIGISAYGDGNLEQLQNAANDATDLASAFPLVKKGGLFGDCKVHLLTNKEATAKAVADKLAALSKDANQNDVVVIYFAGHGVRQDGETYLLTYESKVVGKALVPNTALSGKELAQRLGKVKGSVLLLLDASNDGALGLRFRGGIYDLARHLGDDDPGVIVLASTTGQGKAGRGFFAAAIKDALEGKGRVPRDPRDGRLYLHNLYSYLAEGAVARGTQMPYLHQPLHCPTLAIRQFELEK